MKVWEGYAGCGVVVLWSARRKKKRDGCIEKDWMGWYGVSNDGVGNYSLPSSFVFSSATVPKAANGLDLT